MPNPMPLRSLAPLFLLVAAAPAFAFQPFVTDDTGTQGTGGNQLEFSFTRDRRSAPDTVDTTRTAGTVFTRGFTDTLDVFVQANRTAVHSTGTGLSASGGGNPSFGAKWRFYEDADSGVSLALRPEVFLPISAARERDRLGRGKTSHGVTLIATQEVPFGAIHANLFEGRDRYQDAETNPHSRTTRVSLAPVWDVTEKWKLGVDLGTETTSAGGVRTRTNVTSIGTVCSPNKDLDFALGVIRRADANGDSPATTNSLTAGVTWRF